MNTSYKEINFLTKYKGAIHNVVTGLQEILGDRLLSVYGCGSWVRNETRVDSDIDFFFIINSNISESEKNAVRTLEKKILSNWSFLGFTGVDIRFVNEKDEENYFTVAHKEIIQLDGYLLYGTRFSWDIYKDYSILEIVDAFNKITVYIYKNLLKVNDVDPRVKERSRRSLAKTVLRTIEWLAVLEGAPISHSITEYSNHAKTYVPKLAEASEKSMEIYKKDIISNTDITFLDETLKKLINPLN